MLELPIIEERENFGKSFDEFVSYWEEETKELKQREITEEDSHVIALNFELSKTNILMFRKIYDISISDYRKIDLLFNKLQNSLAIARSNFRSKHRTYGERIIDSVGGLFHFLKRD